MRWGKKWQKRLLDLQHQGYSYDESKEIIKAEQTKQKRRKSNKPLISMEKNNAS